MNNRLFRQLGELIAQDFDINARSSNIGLSVELDALRTEVCLYADRAPTVYTAFDGDHFQLCGYMRSYVLQTGHVPANPESILGYKDTVTAHGNKRGVLLDDLAVLRRCDELWVFTDLPAELASLQHLAEGVVVELLFFLKRWPDRRVAFVPMRDLFLGKRPSPVRYDFSYDQSKAALHEDQRDGVLVLANSNYQVDQELSPLVFHMLDPLDFKYAHWLRPHAYNSDLVPLVPGLAIELDDLGTGPEALGRVLVAWAKLARLADKAWLLPSMECGRSPSIVCALLQHIWLCGNPPDTVRHCSWLDYQIPKARKRRCWSLTRREGRV